MQWWTILNTEKYEQGQISMSRQNKAYSKAVFCYIKSFYQSEAKDEVLITLFLTLHIFKF